MRQLRQIVSQNVLHHLGPLRSLLPPANPRPSDLAVSLVHPKQHLPLSIKCIREMDEDNFMSFNYILSVSSTQSPAAAFQTISILPGFEAVAEDVAFGPGVTVIVADADEEDKEYALEHEGFEPTLDILFVEDHKDVSGEVATTNIVRAVVALLHYANGEAVLRYNNEILLLRLHKNDLVLNTQPEFWEWYPQLLQLVTLPYRLAALSSK